MYSWMISNCIFAVMSVIEWDHGLMDGCGGAYLMNYLPQRILKAFFFQLQRKERQGLAQLGQLIFCLILLSFDFLSDYQIIFLILVWGSHFLSEFLLSSDFPILILFSPIFFQPPRKRRARPRWENWFMALCKFFAKNRQRLLLTYYQRSQEIYPSSLKKWLELPFYDRNVPLYQSCGPLLKIVQGGGGVKQNTDCVKVFWHKIDIRFA